jgi:DNA-binding MarR family transcriptional regulator
MEGPKTQGPATQEVSCRSIRSTREGLPMSDAALNTAEVARRKRSRSNSAKKARVSDVFDERRRTVAWMTRTVHRKYDSETQKILDKENISISHWFYLRVLAERGDLNQLELSQRVGFASTTAVPALDSMERRGLVKRTRDPKDRRKYYVSITNEGRRLVEKLMPEIIEMISSTLHGIASEEMRIFWGVLHRIEENLNVMAGGDTVID